jgi:predicted membrane GTPase involved in stress response
LELHDEQMLFPVVFTQVESWVKQVTSPDNLGENLFYLLDQIIEHIPAPKVIEDEFK